MLPRSAFSMEDTSRCTCTSIHELICSHSATGLGPGEFLTAQVNHLRSLPEPSGVARNGTSSLATYWLAIHRPSDWLSGGRLIASWWWCLLYRVVQWVLTFLSFIGVGKFFHSTILIKFFMYGRRGHKLEINIPSQQIYANSKGGL